MLMPRASLLVLIAARDKWFGTFYINTNVTEPYKTNALGSAFHTMNAVHIIWLLVHQQQK